MMCGLLINRIDQIERMLAVVALVRLRLNPDRKEFRPEVAATSLVEADVAVVVRICGTDIESFIEKALRSIGVSVNHESRIVDGAGFGGYRQVRRIGRGLCGYKRAEAQDQQKMFNFHI